MSITDRHVDEFRRDELTSSFPSLFDLARKMQNIIRQYIARPKLFDTFVTAYVKELPGSLWVKYWSMDDEQLEEIILADWNLLVLPVQEDSRINEISNKHRERVVRIMKRRCVKWQKANGCL